MARQACTNTARWLGCPSTIRNTFRLALLDQAPNDRQKIFHGLALDKPLNVEVPLTRHWRNRLPAHVKRSLLTLMSLLQQEVEAGRNDKRTDKRGRNQSSGLKPIMTPIRALRKERIVSLA